MRPIHAGEKWCPFAKVNGGINRDLQGQPAQGSQCIGPQCMAWATSPDKRKGGHCELINFPPYIG